MVRSLGEIVTTFKPDKSRNLDSRYRMSLRCRDSVGNEFLESFDLIEILMSESGWIHRVEPGEKNSLDMIAYRYYRNPLLWWIIALANNISNPLYLEPGTVLRIPGLDVVYGYKGVLS